MPNYPDYHIVSACLDKIEESLNWGPSSEWYNKEFDELSELITQKTGVMLSTTTLKRVWGRVDYKSAPSKSTLDALTQYIGYTNWRSFKVEHSPESKVKKKLKAPSSLLSYSTLFIAIFVIAGLSLLFGLNRNDEPVDLSGVSFSSRAVATGVPNSVVFDLELQGINSDSMFIQQYWDPTKTIKLKKDQKQATGIYYYPGHFRAKLLIDGQLVQEHPLFIKSDGWTTTLDYKPIPKYIDTQLHSSSGLTLDSMALKELMSLEDPITSTYSMVDDYRQISADDMILKTRLKNSYNDKWAVCQTASIFILGSEGAAIVPFCLPGCVSNISVMLNDVYLSGKENDLSALGSDLSDFQDVELHIKDKKLQVRLSDEEIFDLAYAKSIGDLVGVRFRFLGAGQVESLIIESESDTLSFLN